MNNKCQDNKVGNFSHPKSFVFEGSSETLLLQLAATRSQLRVLLHELFELGIAGLVVADLCA